jgi:threonine dehydratase
MDQSIKAGQRVTLTEVGLFSDGTAVKRVGEETLRLCQKYVDEIVLVDTDAICAAIKDVFEDTRAILEPAGALAIAGMKHWVNREGVEGKTLVAIARRGEALNDSVRLLAIATLLNLTTALLMPRQPISMLACRFVTALRPTRWQMP